MSNSVYPNQMLLEEQSDLGLHCLLRLNEQSVQRIPCLTRPICLKTLDHDGSFSCIPDGNFHVTDKGKEKSS